MPQGQDAHLVMDSYATHKTPIVKAWLARRPHWYVHVTPASADWMIRPSAGSQSSPASSCTALPIGPLPIWRLIAAVIDAHNENPKPCRSVKSADEILASVRRFCSAARKTNVAKFGPR